MNTTKVFAILTLVGMLLMTIIFLDFEAWPYVIVGGLVFAALMLNIIKLMYPDNDLDDKIDIK